jgi:hypothetical protein
MLKTFKAILAIAAAALISAGAVAASTSAVDAGDDASGHYETKEISVPQTTCQTSYETVSSYDDYNNLVYKQVPHETCSTVYVTEYQQVWVPGVSSDSNY